jgi:hypothetical protein
MSDTLFNRPLIQTRQAAIQARIDELQAGAETRYIGPDSEEARRKREVADLTDAARGLARAMRASDFIDRGDKTVLSEGWRVAEGGGRIMAIPVDFDLFARKPLFAYLGDRADSPTLLLRYRAERGAALITIDLRYNTAHGFAALDELDGLGSAEPLAEQVLQSRFVRPQTIGLNELSLWPISIRLPRAGVSALGCDMSTGKGIVDAFRAWLHAHVPRRDGFIQWDDPRISNLARLTWTEWWTEAL